MVKYKNSLTNIELKDREELVIIDTLESFTTSVEKFDSFNYASINLSGEILYD